MEYHYSISRDKSFTIDTSNIANCEFHHLSLDANQNGVQMSWNCSLESDLSSNNLFADRSKHASITSLEIDVPEMLYDIKQVIHEELVKVLKVMEDKLINTHYKITVLYRKSSKMLTVTLPAKNSEQFYSGCNSDLIPLTAQIGQYLRKWDFKAFSHHLKTSTIYYDLSSIDNITSIGVSKNLYDYIHAKHAGNNKFNALIASVTIALVLYIIISGEIFLGSQNTTSSSITIATSQIKFVLAAIVAIIGWMVTPKYDEKMIENDTEEALFKYNRGYTLFCTPPSSQSENNQTCYRY